MAGIVGVEPGPLTLGELIVMAESRQRENWNHTSQVLAMLYNVNRDPKRHRALKPAEFHPFAKKRKQPRLSGKDLTVLRDVFVKQKTPVGGAHKPAGPKREK